jgi:hypothetical protein
MVFDLKPLLWQEIALKEDDLRAFCKEHDWSQYMDKFVSVHCSADAIIPTWAYMLVATHLQPHRGRSSRRAMPTSWNAPCSPRFAQSVGCGALPQLRARGGEGVQQVARAAERVRGAEREAASRGEEPDVRGAVQYRAAVQSTQAFARLRVELGVTS